MTEDGSECADRFERYRAYLRVLSRLQMGKSLRQKLDPSDLVQQVLFKAYQSQRPPEQSAGEADWLREILTNELIDQHRLYSADKRNLAMEQSLQEQISRSSARLANWLASPSSSPSQNASRGEDLLRLAEALERLPDAQRQAVELHHLQGLTVDEVAYEMQCTRPAAAGLLRRGLKNLRTQLNCPDPDPCPHPPTTANDGSMS